MFFQIFYIFIFSNFSKTKQTVIFRIFPDFFIFVMKGDGLTKFSLVFKKNRGGKAPKISRLDGVLRGNIYVILKEISSVALLSPACSYIFYQFCPLSIRLCDKNWYFPSIIAFFKDLRNWTNFSEKITLIWKKLHSQYISSWDLGQFFSIDKYI